MFWYCSPYFHIDDNDKLPTIDRQSLLKSMNDFHYNGPNIAIRSQPVENFYTINRSMMAINDDQQQQRPSIVIEQFEQLLMNRTFLLTLIDTLEQQTKTFTIAERMRFASLLMITLLDRMEYAFDIMRQLLSQLIDRYASSKHSNQLIKRNESIVEKMLIDWLSICLFKYAREISSGPLFLLFSAIKHQIDKGPVDYITGNSRFVLYSLSEEKLLREQIEYKTLTVHVFLDDKLQQTLPISINNRYQGQTSTKRTHHKHRRININTNRMMKKSMDYQDKNDTITQNNA
ncbi:hypothetical protein BLA29_007281, partial [Euroglyphus maynei]